MCAHYTNFEVVGNIKIDIYWHIFDFHPRFMRITLLWLTLLYLICPYIFSKSYKHQFLCWCILLVYRRDRPYTLFLFLGKIFSLKTIFLWKCDIHFILNPGLCRITLILSQVYVEWPSCDLHYGITFAHIFFLKAKNTSFFADAWS